MEFFYFLVTGSNAWENRFHENFFNIQAGFLWGFIGALVIGVICACAFYFGCCNSKKSNKSANLGVWAITMLICAGVAYFYADFVIIGDSKTSDDSSIFHKYSFYRANDIYLVNEINPATSSLDNITETDIKDLKAIHNKIKTNLDKGGDVRFDYDITTALLAAIFFFITSLIVKRFTIAGKTIPFQKP